MGKTGFRVPNNDHELAAAMARLLDDVGLRVRLADGAAERVQRFTASAVVERLEAVYARVAQRDADRSMTPDQRRLRVLMVSPPLPPGSRWD